MSVDLNDWKPQVISESDAARSTLISNIGLTWEVFNKTPV